MVQKIQYFEKSSVATGCLSSPALHPTLSGGDQHLVVFQAGNHDFRQDDHTRPAHACTAVHQQWWVGALGLTRIVGVSADGLDLFQVSCQRPRRE